MKSNDEKPPFTEEVAEAAAYVASNLGKKHSDFEKDLDYHLRRIGECRAALRKLRVQHNGLTLPVDGDITEHDTLKKEYCAMANRVVNELKKAHDTIEYNNKYDIQNGEVQ